MIGQNESSVSQAAIRSVVVSCLSIGYTSSTLSCDMDTDPHRRQMAPNVYGYMPDQGRTLVMFFMVMLTLSHVLMKILACALILRLSNQWFMLYFLSDMGIFFIYKIII